MIRGKYKKKTYSMRKQHKKIDAAPATTSYSECCFCKEGNSPELGNFFQDKDANLAAHQFCLLFSCGLPQAGSDQDDFEGFLFKDIKKENRRVRRSKCKFCLKYGASSGCFVKSCHFTYHYKCGLRNNAQFDFFGTFNTFCYAHRSFQDLSYILNGSSLPSCPICMDVINETAISVLKMPCCRNVFAHKECVQNQAMASGYFFKCPTCKNEKDFKREMARFGVYIPQRDASWEENDAYSELLQQYQSCDLPSCKCPMGKNYEEESGKWELIRCYHCGQGAVHGYCLGKRQIPVYRYICQDCNEVTGVIKNSTYLPEKSRQQTLVQKRLMQERLASGDPLLTSCIQAPLLTSKQFDVKPCRVEVRRLSKSNLCKFQLGRQNFISDDTNSCGRRHVRNVVEETADVENNPGPVATSSESKPGSSPALETATDDNGSTSKRGVLRPFSEKTLPSVARLNVDQEMKIEYISDEECVDWHESSVEGNVLHRSIEDLTHKPEFLILSDGEIEEKSDKKEVVKIKLGNSDVKHKFKLRSRPNQHSKINQRSKITFYMAGGKFVEPSTSGPKAKRKRKGKVVEKRAKNTPLDVWLKKTLSPRNTTTECDSNTDTFTMKDEDKLCLQLSESCDVVLCEEENNNVSSELLEQSGNNSNSILTPIHKEITIDID